MAFSQFEHVNMVLEKYPLRIKREPFLPDRAIEIPSWLAENIRFGLEKKQMNDNEYFYRETFVYPVLLEVWKRHRQLRLWSHQSIYYTEELSGASDYLLSYIPDTVIHHLITTPLLAVMEAKKENFTEGWGQCLAELIACQRLNDQPQMSIYGIVTTGELWQVGKLWGDTFTEHPFPFAIDNPNLIFGVLDWIFTTCEQELASAHVNKA